MNIRNVLLFLGLLCAVLTACSKQSEPDEIGQAAPTQTIELSLHGVIDDEQLRALQFDMDAQGLPKINLASLKDASGKVIVRCVFHGTGGGLPDTRFVISIPFDLDEDKRELSVYKFNVNIPTSHGYHNLNGRRWYITGVINGTVSAEKFEFKDNEVQSKSAAHLGTGKFEVPIMFPWTEISFSESERGYIPKVTFSPRGSIFRIRWWNDLPYPIRVSEPHFISNAFGTDGYFMVTQTAAPVSVGGYLPYTFDNTAPGEHIMLHGFKDWFLDVAPGTHSDVYYLWVMPRATPPAMPKTYIQSATQTLTTPAALYMKGKLQIKGGAIADFSMGVPQHGKTYKLEVHISGRPPLPIESAAPSEVSLADPQSTQHPTPQTVFPLRSLATLHTLPGWPRAYIPIQQEWTALFPYTGQVINFTTASGPTSTTEEYQRFNSNTYGAEYLNTGNGVTYAIRFAKTTTGSPEWPAASSNILRCAYRYERKSPTPYGPHALEIRVRYLGDNTSINSVSDVQAAYWATPDPTEITRTLPAYSSSEVRDVGGGKYWLADQLPGTFYWVRVRGTNDFDCVGIGYDKINDPTTILYVGGTLNQTSYAWPIIPFK